MRLALLFAAALIALAAPSCKKTEKKEPAAEKLPPAISKGEKKRGIDACTDFKVKVCECSTKHPDREKLSKHCELADSRLQAIEITIRTSLADGITADDRKAANSNVRKTVQKCVEQASKLAIDCGGENQAGLL